MNRRMTDSDWRDLSPGFVWRHVAIPASPGPLAYLASRGLSVASRDGLLVALGLHAAVPDAAIDHAMGGLLSQARHLGPGIQTLRAVENEVLRLHENGGFYDVGPEVLAATTDGRHGIYVWRAGPNGVAAARHGVVELRSRDLRYSALAGLGVDLVALRLRPQTSLPLADEVFGLTQLRPPDCQQNELLLEVDEVALLVSRGGLPFHSSSGRANASDWWQRDSGLRYGMAADLILIVSEAKVHEADEIVRDFGNGLPPLGSGPDNDG